MGTGRRWVSFGFLQTYRRPAPRTRTVRRQADGMAGKGKNTHPGAPGVRPERLSFATLPHAVLLQAVVDAGILLSDARHSRGGRRESVTGPKRTGQKARDRAQARVEAITFLTDSGGDW